LQAYWGNLQQIMPLSERQRLAGIQQDRLRALIAALKEAGLVPEVVSGAGTGTHAVDGRTGLLTELQPGSFLFMDSCYGSIVTNENENPFEPSLFVAASVVSNNRPGCVIVNAGWKAFATDSGKPQPRRGAPANATYRFMGDEHGAVDFEGSGPALGATIEFLTSHCDPTVNLHPAFHVVKGDELVDIWKIRARY
jgi:D-serine deaminase-like pyridoxal phosphate-dependent protein